MARRSIPKSRLLEISGMDVVIAKMEKIIAATAGGQQGDKLKRLYVDAAAIHSNQVRTNIRAMDASDKLKESLLLSVVTNRGPDNKPNAISRVTQTEAIDINPYWFEYGTVPRATGKGANRGMVKPTEFFRPAIKQSGDKVVEYLVDGLKKLTGL